MTTTNHQLTTVRLAEAPDAWRRAGFRVDRDGRCTLGSTTLVLVDPSTSTTPHDPDSPEGPPAWHLEATPAIDGIPTCAAVQRGPDDHPNGIVGIDHVVVRSGDADRTVAAFESAGMDARGGRSTTSYGSPMRQVFFWAGDVIVELIGPDLGEPPTDEPTAIWGLALVADDLDLTTQRLGGLLSAPKDAVQLGRRIAGLRGREVGIGLPVAVMSPHPRRGRGLEPK